MHRIITMHARLRRTDGQTDGQTGEHLGNSAMIRSMNASHAKKEKKETKTDKTAAKYTPFLWAA